MKNKKIIASLLATILISISISYVSASYNDRYDNDGRYEKYDDEYIKISNLPQKIKDYISKNYSSSIIKAEKDDGEYEVKLRNGTEVKFYLNGDFKYAEIDDDYYKYKKYDDDKYENRTQYIEERKTINIELKAKYKASFKSKLGDRLKNIPKAKLEKIIILIDTKLLNLTIDKTKTTEQKEKLVAIYGAIKELINDELFEINSENILDELLK